ncbi:hypothetical protein NQ176_g5280 [Zarea fungicola]|uniref:Uncharacterized protein n=1 Tax=Zarea fungicola TaxID=93591 RepID=A0ACC1N986_9HYPO|nr:hypothetical protein NQ176_g5280 [Lecanicillium fungicola]
MAVVGSPGLLLAAPEPGDNELLPSHDLGWTQGSIGSNEALLTQAFHPATSLGPFAKTCQAVHMLGKVLRHYNIRNTTTETKELVEEALALHRALLALDSSITPEAQVQNEDSGSSVNDASHHALDPAIAICSIARLILYNQYACNVPNQPAGSLRVAEEAEAQAVSLHGIQVLATERISALARSIVTDFAMRGEDQVASHNPILGKCFYHAATECAWFVKEDENGEAMLAALKSIIGALRVLETEWGVAGKSLSQ